MSERVARSGVPVPAFFARRGRFTTVALWGAVSLILGAGCDCGDSGFKSRPEAMTVVGGDPTVNPGNNDVLQRPADPGNFAPTSPLQCDSFLQKSASKVDVLWVIDDTGSMGPKQQLVRNNFVSFMQRLQQPGDNGTVADYHIGVVTTDTISGPKSGRLQNKAGLNRPWVGTDTCGNGCDPVEKFRLNADVGTLNTTGEAKGLLAASLALTPPLSVGANAGFLRDDAKLIVVIVSDTEDSSCAPMKGPPTYPDALYAYGCEGSVLEYGKVDYYVRLLRGLKGEGREGDVKLYAFVGTTKDLTVPQSGGLIEGCLAANGSPSDPSQYAYYAERYITAATAITGPAGAQSICSDSFEEIIGDFGTTLQTAFFLTRTPVQSTTRCTLTKDSVTTPVPATDFTVDLARGAVDFVPAKAPSAGTLVKCCYSVR